MLTVADRQAAFQFLTGQLSYEWSSLRVRRLRENASAGTCMGSAVAMVIHDVAQRSPEWFALRRGIPTASQFGKIITSRGLASQQARHYLQTLVAELMNGDCDTVSAGGYWLDRGNELEPEAVASYEQETNLKTKSVGFVTDVGRTMGCSPDRLVGTAGLLEVKCPAPHTHAKYLRCQRIDSRYYPQVQGQLLITGRRWVDFYSYHPDQPSLKLRVFRDEPYLANLNQLLQSFIETLQSHTGRRSLG